MTLDRTLAPEFKIIKSIELPNAELHTLSNGCNLHLINIGEQPIVRLEVIFEAGTWYESHPQASYFAVKMLSEGTSSRSSAQISESFETLGAFTDMTHSMDRCGVTVYCLSRVLPEVLSIVTDLIQNATFPEKELDDLKNITLQNLKINLEKTAYLATTEFRGHLFGKKHPYGKCQTEFDISNLTRAHIIDHYTNHIRNSEFKVILAGQIPAGHTEAVNKTLGGLNVSESKPSPTFDLDVPYQGRETVVSKEESVQSSIRIGRKLMMRSHPDYFKMLVANEILGGYFGSRLMKNIREEKGLTYGISSHVATLGHEGYFMIGTDVKKEFTTQTIDEIKKEIRRLQEELVGEDELQTVKNFMAGELAGSLNTAFDIADRQKIILLDKLPTDFFDRYIKNIHATTILDIKEMALKYLSPETMVEVIVGGK